MNIFHRQKKNIRLNFQKHNLKIKNNQEKTLDKEIYKIQTQMETTNLIPMKDNLRRRKLMSHKKIQKMKKDR